VLEQFPKAVTSPIDQSHNADPAALIAALQLHFRSKLQDSAVTVSPAWKQARLAIRLLNHLSPLLLGVIQRPGSDATLQERRNALDFMTATTDALSKVMAERLAPSQTLGEYDQLELNSLLAHLVGRLWTEAAGDPQGRIEDLLSTVSGLYADSDFLNRRHALANSMMQAGGYLKVDSPETMETRLRISMHLAASRFYEAVADDRLGNGKGLIFTYGKGKMEVVKVLLATFDQVMARIFRECQFSSVLSNDQRTSIMQSWMRNASDICRGEYVAETMRVMTWFRAGERESREEFHKRFAEAKAFLPRTMSKVLDVSTQTVIDLIRVSDSGCLEDRKVEERPDEIPNIVG
jgi:hypothetical protein